MHQITVSASMDQIKPVTDFINARLAELACPESTRIQIDVAVDEIFGNIVRYGYEPDAGGWVSVRFDAGEDPPCAVLTFRDAARPFDPLKAQCPDRSGLPLRERPVGGWGLMMVKQIMDGMTYEYRDGQNVLTMRKNI